MAHYRNKTKQEQVVIGHGVVKAGESFEAPDDFYNPNFEKTSQSSAKKTETKPKES